MKFIRALFSDIGRLLLSTLVLSVSFLPPIVSIPYADLVLRALSLLIIGFGVFLDAVRGILRRDLLDEKFLMSVASIGAFILGDYVEAVAVLAFFTIGECFEHYAVRRSRESIRALMSIRPDTAVVLRDGEEEELDAEDVAVGETIVCRSGDRIALDGVILSGTGELDRSMLTGESMPIPVEVGDRVESGAVVLNGYFHIQATKLAEESCAARILELVEMASDRKSKEESFITRFSRVYTPIVVGLAVLLCFLLSVFSIVPFAEAFKRSLTFLVISCPCALVISVPMAFFGGIGCAASRGILFKGGNTFRALTEAKTFVFDKTGTLTSGSFRVIEAVGVDISKDELMHLVASAEHASNHPLARAIKESVGEYTVPSESEERSGYGVISRVGEDQIAVGNRRLMQSLGISLAVHCFHDEIGVLYAAKNGVYLGYLRLEDAPRPTTAAALSELRKLGAKQLVVLSGDHSESVKRIADAVGVDSYEGALLPEEKFERLEALIASGERVVYVGDGINDTPSLARADVGVSMGGIGQDSALEASDLSILTDDLARLPEAIRIAGKTLSIAKENIVFAIGIKVFVLILGALGLASMWLAVFADVGVCVLAILNSMRTLIFKKA